LIRLDLRFGVTVFAARCAMKPRSAGYLESWTAHTAATRLAFWIAHWYPLGYNVAHEYL
jgi:hypothetical protein